MDWQAAQRKDSLLVLWLRKDFALRRDWQV
jgi:hypothetical protein